jgi:endonuclease/exonuclease/phosphatase family metal-dependent hydrolase
LSELDADIVALQEVVNHRGGTYGNVTLTRFEFRSVRHVDLTVSGREERGVLRTDIRLGRHLVHILHVHLGTAHRERKKQAVRLMDEDLLRAIDVSEPRIVLGDFNEWTNGLVTRTLSAEFRLTDLLSHLARTRQSPISSEPAILGDLGPSAIGGGHVTVPMTTGSDSRS